MRHESQPFAIVITGVTRGLGRALACEFLRLGHTVCGCARTSTQIRELASIHPTGDFQVVDVAVDSQVRAWAARVCKKHGPPDLVLNNAAIINEKAVLWDVPACEISAMLNINVGGVCNVVRHFAPLLVSSGRGTIVNFTSRWGEFVEQRMGPYCATKWAIVALTQILAEELRPKGVIVVSLNPGVINTPMLRKYLGGTAATRAKVYQSAEEWATLAAPLILRFARRESGPARDMSHHSEITIGK